MKWALMSVQKIMLPVLEAAFGERFTAAASWMRFSVTAGWAGKTNAIL